MVSQRPPGWRRAVTALIELWRNRPAPQIPAERTLAEQWEMSRASVREGLRVAEAMGALTAAVGSGPTAGARAAHGLRDPLHLFLSLHEAVGTLRGPQVEAARREVEAALLAQACRASEPDRRAAAATIAREQELLASGVLDGEEILDLFRTLRARVWGLVDNPLLIALSEALFEFRWSPAVRVGGDSAGLAAAVEAREGDAGIGAPGIGAPGRVPESLNRAPNRPPKLVPADLSRDRRPEAASVALEPVTAAPGSEPVAVARYMTAITSLTAALEAADGEAAAAAFAQFI